MYVRAQVSGFPKRERERRWLVILQACFDDSGSEPNSNAYVLAGWMAPVPAWELFTDEWEVELKAGPKPLDYFKMNDAMGLTGQFDGWCCPDRDRKVLSLANIITRHHLVRVGVGLHRPDYDAIIKPSFPPNFFADPYFMLFYECAMLIGQSFADMITPTETCYLIFDKQGKIGGRAQRYWKKAVKGFQEVGFGYADRAVRVQPGRARRASKS